uniref:Uncharacterized protein n=1 Tax=Glossina brevipalpis TaxID=37001 RepID=A0A1A9W2T7_9MUSC
MCGICSLLISHLQKLAQIMITSTGADFDVKFKPSPLSITDCAAVVSSLTSPFALIVSCGFLIGLGAVLLAVLLGANLLGAVLVFCPTPPNAPETLVGGVLLVACEVGFAGEGLRGAAAVLVLTVALLPVPTVVLVSALRLVLVVVVVVATVLLNFGAGRAVKVLVVGQELLVALDFVREVVTVVVVLRLPPALLVGADDLTTVLLPAVDGTVAEVVFRICVVSVERGEGGLVFVVDKPNVVGFDGADAGRSFNPPTLVATPGTLRAVVALVVFESGRAAAVAALAVVFVVNFASFVVKPAAGLRAALAGFGLAVTADAVLLAVIGCLTASGFLVIIVEPTFNLAGAVVAPFVLDFLISCVLLAGTFLVAATTAAAAIGAVASRAAASTDLTEASSNFSGAASRGVVSIDLIEISSSNFSGAASSAFVSISSTEASSNFSGAASSAFVSIDLIETSSNFSGAASRGIVSIALVEISSSNFSGVVDTAVVSMGLMGTSSNFSGAASRAFVSLGLIETSSSFSGVASRALVSEEILTGSSSFSQLLVVKISYLSLSSTKGSSKRFSFEKLDILSVKSYAGDMRAISMSSSFSQIN